MAGATFVQKKYGWLSIQYAGGSVTLSLAAGGADVTAGDLIIAVVAYAYSGMPISLSDTVNGAAGNASSDYTPFAAALEPNDFCNLRVFWARAKASGALVVSIAPTDNVAGRHTGDQTALTVLHYTGVVAASPLDGTPVTSLTADGDVAISTTQADDLVVAVLLNDYAMNADGAGWTLREAPSPPDVYLRIVDKVDAPQGTNTGQFVITTGTYFSKVAAAFKTVVPVNVTDYYPTEDVANPGAWTDQVGGSSNLYSTIDETSPGSSGDNDYIQSPLNPTAAVYKTRFGALQTPGLSTNHKISYRIKSDANCPVVVKLVAGDGSTVIKTWTHDGSTGFELPSSFQTFDRTDLTAGEIANWAAAGYPNSELWIQAG